MNIWYSIYRRMNNSINVKVKLKAKFFAKQKWKFMGCEYNVDNFRTESSTRQELVKYLAEIYLNYVISIFLYGLYIGVLSKMKQSFQAFNVGETEN